MRRSYMLLRARACSTQLSNKISIYCKRLFDTSRIRHRNMRLLPITNGERLVRVSRELRHRGDVYIVADRFHRCLLIGQSVPKLAAAVNSIFKDTEDQVSYQAFYHMLKGGLKRGYHKGWKITRIQLSEAPLFWDHARSEKPYQMAGYVCDHPLAYELATG